jgi:hypothetical protein
MTALISCMESLSVCHRSVDDWQAASMVAKQKIDEYISKAGPDLRQRRQALATLQAEFAKRFPNETNDPALIRSYMEKVDRDLRYEAED